MAARARKDGTGGGATTDGLIYQAAVVVWAALDLMLVQRSATEIDIEPPSHEDAEAELQPDEANGAATRAALSGYRLVIQVKLRNTGPWSVADFKRLLDKGERRQAVSERLAKEANVRFLLVTSADVAAGDMQELKVSEFGEFPSKPPSAASLAPYADSDGARVAIMNVATEWVVEQKIRTLLEDVFKIPHDQVEGCRRALEDEAIRRSRPGNDSVWRRDDLQVVLKAHGAYFSIGPELDDFVEPDNWEALVAQARTGAIVITGQSGSGKTLSALKLCEELRKATKGLKVKDDARTPGDVSRHLNDRPILFYLEDPWGRYLRSPDSLPWNEELLRVLPRARGDLFFVITSRDDILSQAGDIRARLKPWTVALNAEEYGSKARDRLFETRLKRLSPNVALIAVGGKREALRALETPLEIERYFVQLALGPLAGEADHTFLARAIRTAHHTTFEDQVAETVVAREDVGWAALIWALLKAKPLVERQTLTTIRRPVQAAVPRLQGGSLENLVNMLVVGRSLKQPGSAISYAHPRVEAGFEKAMDMEPELSGDVLEATIDALVAQDRHDGETSGRRMAASVLAASVSERDAKDREHTRVTASASSQEAIDNYLEAALSNDPEALFNETIRLAAAAGSDRSTLCELARWLLSRHRPPRRWWFDSWRMEARDDAWFNRVRQAEGTPRLLDRFVRLTLPSEQREYPRSLPQHLARFEVDLGAAFRAAAIEVVDAGYDGRAEAILAGALQDVSAAAEVAAAAGEVISSIRTRNAKGKREDDLPLANGDYDEEYAEHLGTADHDEGYVANQVLDAYIPALRRTQGWRALAASPVAGLGIGRWLKAIEGLTPSKISTAELQAIQARAADAGEEARFAKLVGKTWRPILAEPLLARLRDDNGDPGAWMAIAAVLAEHAPGLVLAAQREWIQAGNAAQTLRLHWAVSNQAPPGPSRVLLLRRLRERAPVEIAALSRALAHPKRPLANDTASTLADLASPDVDFNAELVRLGVAAGVPATAAIEACLRDWDPWHTEPAEAAVAAAVAVQDWTILEQAKDHPLAVVRMVALAAWADRSPAALEEVLERASKETSSTVLRALLGRLTDRPSLPQLDRLLSVAANTWSEYSRPTGEPATYPFARKAAEAIWEISDIPGDRLKDVFEVVRKTEDPDVRLTLLAAMARGGGADGRARMIQFALRPTAKTSLRREVLHALLLMADLLKPGDLIQVTADMILDAPPTLGIALTRLQAAVLPADALEALGSDLAGSPARRVLVLLLNAGRHADLGGKLAALLPAGHPARRILRYPHATSRLPRTSVDDLGDVRTVELTRRALSSRFEPER